MTILRYGRRGGAWVEFGDEALKYIAEGNECALFATNHAEATYELNRFRDLATALGMPCELVQRPHPKLIIDSKGSLVWRGPPDSQRAWRGTLVDPYFPYERPRDWNRLNV